jgi:glycerol-3-phosphate dehydrogenase
MPPLPGSNPQALLLTAPQDRRVFFLIPWYGVTLLGTTDTHYHGLPQHVRVEAQDIAYLLKAVTTCCPGLGWSTADIRGSFAGLRTLVGNAAGGVGSVSREWSLIAAEKQLIVSVGGKLTSARIEAAQVVDRCLNLLNKSMQPCQTVERLFPWAPTEPWSSWFEQTQKKSCQLGLDQMTAAHAARRYGRRINLLFTELEHNPHLAQRIDRRYPFCQGEITMACQHEMALTNDDIFRRRIPLRLLDGTNR